MPNYVNSCGNARLDLKRFVLRIGGVQIFLLY